MFDILTMSHILDDDAEERYNYKQEKREREARKHRKARHEVDHRVLKHQKIKKEKDERYIDSDRNDYKKEIIFIGGLIVLVFMVYGAGGFDNFTLIPPFNLSQGGVGSTAPTVGVAIEPRQTYSGQLGVQVYHRDALDLTESREEGIDLNTTYYKKADSGNFYPMTFGDDEIITIDGDTQVYIAIEPTEDSGIFIAPMSILDANPRIYDVEFMDIDKDSFQEWVFKVDLLDLQESGYSAPNLVFYSFFFDNGLSHLTSPSDIVHAGSSWIRWELVIPEETVLVVSAVRVDISTSDPSILNEGTSFIQIPFIGQVQFSEMDVVHFADKTSYLYDIGKDIGGSDYIVTQRNADTNHPIPVHINTARTFGELDEELQVTLILTIASPEQKFSDLKDSVTLIPTEVGLEDISIKESIRCTDVDENNEWINCKTITKVDYNNILNSTIED